MAYKKIEFDGHVLIDLTDTTADVGNVLSGKKFHKADGTLDTGTMTNRGAVSATITTQNGEYTIPAGYHNGSGKITAQLSSGSVSAPTAEKSLVSNHSVSITPSVSYSGGYISAGSKTGTAVTVKASDLVSGTKTFTAPGTGLDVGDYKYANIDIPTQAAKTVTPGTSNVTAVTAGYYTSGNVTVKGDSNLIAGNIKSGISIFGVAGSYSPTISTQEKTPSINFSATSTVTVTPDSGYGGLSKVVINKPIDLAAGNILSGKTIYGITGSIASKTASDVTVSGPTFTIPTGYYSSTVSKAVSTVSRATTTLSSTADSTNGKFTLTAGNNQGTGYVTGSNSTATKTVTLTISGKDAKMTDGSTTITKSVATGTAGTPTATKSGVSGNAITVTPKVTNTTGYITGSTITGTAVTVKASDLVSGTKSITAPGTSIDVTNYKYASVAAGGISGTAGATSTIGGSQVKIDFTATVTCSGGYIDGSTKTYGGTYTIAVDNPVSTASFNSDGQMHITPESGHVIYHATINKPDTLIPSNVKSGVNIAGITGTYTGGIPAIPVQIISGSPSLTLMYVSVNCGSSSDIRLGTTSSGLGGGSSFFIDGSSGFHCRTNYGPTNKIRVYDGNPGSYVLNREYVGTDYDYVPDAGKSIIYLQFEGSIGDHGYINIYQN